MSTEKLEELLRHIEERKSRFGLDLMPISSATVASLARRVIAAEKLVEELEYARERLAHNGCFVGHSDALTAYREACK